MKKVLCGGAFDILHPGHLWFLQKAKSYGDHLTVVVARDTTVKANKGKLPVIPEKQRLEMVKGLKVVDNAILGDKRDFVNTVKKVNPHVVVLGFDQKIDQMVSGYLHENGIKLVRLKKKVDGDLQDTSKIVLKILGKFS